MKEQAFADAAKPASVTILRLPMLNYSVGHEILLINQGNLILLSEESFNTLNSASQKFSIIRACMICSRTWEQNKKPDKWLRLWGWTIRKANFELAIADFRNYRKNGSSCPKVNPQDKGRILGSPFMARLIEFGSARFGNSVFDQPIGMLQWLYFSHAEHNGWLEVENETDEAIKSELAKIQKERCQHSTQ